MKKARFVAVAAVLVAAVVVGLAPVVAADPADYPVTLFPSGAASPFSITRGPDGALWFTFSNATEFGNAIGRIDTAGNVTRFELPSPGSQPGYITAGHDEYWTQLEYYDAINAANRGVSLAFFGGNDLYRQVREVPDLSGHANRWIACYRGAPDPASSQVGVLGISLNSTDWKNLGYTEAKLIRTEWIGFYNTLQPLTVTNTSHWVFQGSGLTDGNSLPYLLGYEADGVTNPIYLSFPWHKITVLAKSPYIVYTAVGTEQTVSNAVIDEYQRGNFVFNAATVVWPLALTSYFPAGLQTTWTPRPPVLPAIRRITTNVLSRMQQGVPPMP